MSAILYKNASGKEVISHSYSSGEMFRSCNYLYYADKILGFKRKDKSAALKFGRALESALAFFHTNGCKSDTGSEEFRRLWLAEKENTDVQYTKQEKSWLNLYHAGAQLLKLYEVVLPSLPIKDPLFQMHLEKTVFPGTTLADLKMQGFVDMLSKAPKKHPLLPPAVLSKEATYRPLIIDIKTAGKSLDATPDMLTLDPQLQTYSWLSGVMDVAFLWFVKSVHDDFERGTEITHLEKSIFWNPGDKAIVFQVVKELSTLIVGTAHNIVRAKAILECIKGRGSTERKEKALYRFMRSGRLSPVPISNVTKMRMQFVAVRMDPEYVKEAGQVVAKDMVNIVDAWDKQFFPRSPGVRFPNNRCTFCSHRGMCLKNSQLVDDLLVKIENPKPEDDWMDELGEDE